jgi:hypothetical protein
MNQFDEAQKKWLDIAVARVAAQLDPAPPAPPPADYWSSQTHPDAIYREMAAVVDEYIAYVRGPGAPAQLVRDKAHSAALAAACAGAFPRGPFEGPSGAYQPTGVEHARPGTPAPVPPKPQPPPLWGRR